MTVAELRLLSFLLLGRLLVGGKENEKKMHDGGEDKAGNGQTRTFSRPPIRTYAMRLSVVLEKKLSRHTDTLQAHAPAMSTKKIATENVLQAYALAWILAVHLRTMALYTLRASSACIQSQYVTAGSPG